MSIYAVVPVLVGSLIALLVYLYRNRIGYSVITIEGDISNDSDQIKIIPRLGSIKAERLKIRNYGIRNLDKIELHFIVREKPASIKVRNVSSISEKSVKMDWQDKILTISLDNLPSKEIIEIDIVRVGHYEPIDGRLKGAGGKYKIVRMELHDIKVNLVKTVLFCSCLAIVPAIGLWLDNRTPVTKPQRTNPPTLAPASTKG